MTESIHIDNVEFWHDVICTHLLEGECSQIGPDFSVDLYINRPSDIQFTRVRGVGHKFSRTEKHVRHSDHDDFVLVLQLKGSAVQVQDGRELLVGPGALTCNDASRPLQLTPHGDFEQFIVQIPRQIVLGALGPTERFTTIELSPRNPMCKVLVPFLQNVNSVLDEISSKTASQLSQTAMSLIVTTLAEQSEMKLDNPGWARNSLLYRAEEFIQTHSRNPELNSQAVATALNINVRYLQEIFRTIEKTPSQYIWESRLQKSEQDLANPCLASLTISDISMRSGFSDFAHFSHRFREAYGMSPRDFRTRSLARATALIGRPIKGISRPPKTVHEGLNAAE